MEQGAPVGNSRLNQTRQPPPPYYGQFFTPEFNSSGTPYYWTPRQMDKQPPPPSAGITEQLAEEPQSYLAMLNDIQISDTQQIGPSFSRPPALAPRGNSTQQTNNMMVETPPPFRAMGDLGNQNPTYNVPNYGVSLPLPIGASNYAEGSSSRSKGKMICQDDIVPNHPGSWNSNFNRGGQGYSSSYRENSGAGYSVYDERYQGLGLHVDPHLRMFSSSIHGNGNMGYM